MKPSLLLLKCLVLSAGILTVAGGVEEHSDPKEHKREGGKSKSTTTNQL